jgi:hypothetical protein
MLKLINVKKSGIVPPIPMYIFVSPTAIRTFIIETWPAVLAIDYRAARLL